MVTYRVHVCTRVWRLQNIASLLLFKCVSYTFNTIDKVPLIFPWNSFLHLAHLHLCLRSRQDTILHYKCKPQIRQAQRRVCTIGFFRRGNVCIWICFSSFCFCVDVFVFLSRLHLYYYNSNLIRSAGSRQVDRQGSPDQMRRGASSLI